MKHSGIQKTNPMTAWHRDGFTLLELLVVIAVMGLLVAILLPSLFRAKLLANVTKAKAELYGVSVALLSYHEEHKAFPLARTYCEYGNPAKAPDWAELPPELADNYYAAGPAGSNLTLDAVDPFNPGRTYKYLKPGLGYHNKEPHRDNKTYITIYVPDEFPSGDSTKGKIYSNEKNSPVSFVLWSVGTIGDIGYWESLDKHHPFDTREWYGNNGDEGLIVRAYMKAGTFVLSP